MVNSVIYDDPPTAKLEATLLLAHGAGAPMDSPFMNQLALALSACGVRVARFEFPYMSARRAEGGKRPPDPMPRLLDAYRGVVASVDGPVIVSGKSMGGRVASMLADELGARAAVCFGYPFHPPGKPEKRRTEHLLEIITPTLIVQGTRDPFGKPAEVASYGLSRNVEMQWLESGDHDFKPLKASGLDQAGLIRQAARAAVRFSIDRLR